jgi:hypothetical protein
VHLLADVASGRKRHQDQLEIVAGVEDPPEVAVLDGALFDIVAIAFHA